MELINKFFSYLKIWLFIAKENKSISKFVLYKIIDRIENRKDIYIIQCVNSKSTFEACITEIVYDTDILYGLHPLQACFIGIEYVKFAKNNKINLKDHIKNTSAISSQVVHKYGVLALKYQDRNGDICFINSNTNQENIMNPKDIAFSDHLISNFHSEQSFFIGMCAGQKIYNTPASVIYIDKRDILRRNNILQS